MQQNLAAQTTRKHNRDPRSLAKGLRSYLKSIGLDLGQGHALEAIARLQNLPSYDALSAALRQPSATEVTGLPPAYAVDELVRELSEVDLTLGKSALCDQADTLVQRAKALMALARAEDRRTDVASTIRLSEEDSGVVGVEMNIALRDTGLSLEHAEAYNRVFKGIFGEDHESMARRRKAKSDEVFGSNRIRVSVEHFGDGERLHIAQAGDVTVELHFDRNLDASFGYLDVAWGRQDDDESDLCSGVCVSVPWDTDAAAAEAFIIRMLKFVVRSREFEVGTSLRAIEFKGLSLLRNNGFEGAVMLKQVERLAGFKPSLDLSDDVHTR